MAEIPETFQAYGKMAMKQLNLENIDKDGIMDAFVYKISASSVPAVNNE